MKYYTSATQFNCGIDLHARSMYVCLMDPQGKKLVHTNIRNNDFDYYRVHQGLCGHTPSEMSGGRAHPQVNLHGHDWHSHCKGPFELPVAA